MRPNEVDPVLETTSPRPEEDKRGAESYPAKDPAMERRELSGAHGAARWQEIKSRFVDDPAGAVAEADDLVRQAIEDKVRRMKDEHEELRRRAKGDGGGDDANDTEGMRNRLIRYQAYYESIYGVTAH